MKQITLKLTAEEARTVYRALIRASMSAEKEIETAAEFPGSDVLQGSGGKRRKSGRRKLTNLPRRCCGISPSKSGTKTGTEGLTGGRNHGNERNHLSGI